MNTPAADTPAASTKAPASIEQRASFDSIRYASCWEDADILCEALAPGPGDRLLSIASAGDNALALLATGAEVVAADLSAAQLACLELRCAAFRRLSHEELLAFLGVRDSDSRARTYRALRSGLSTGAASFWDAHADLVEAGVIHGGKFERYFRSFRRFVIPLIHRRATVRALLSERDRATREQFYEQRWNNLRWRVLFRLFFSRRVMGVLGRDPEFFRFVQGSVSERILARARHALTALPTHDNPFLNAILTGNFGSALPRYLRPEHFEPIRAGLDRLTLHHGPIDEAAEAHRAGGFSGFNLSDLFEYLDPETCHAVYGKLLDAARPRARLAYWNMLAPRRVPEPLADRVHALDELSRELLDRDRAFFYSAFVVEEVR